MSTTYYTHGYADDLDSFVFAGTALYRNRETVEKYLLGGQVVLEVTVRVADGK